MLGHFDNGYDAMKNLFVNVYGDKISRTFLEHVHYYNSCYCVWLYVCIAAAEIPFYKNFLRSLHHNFFLFTIML